MDDCSDRGNQSSTATVDLAELLKPDVENKTSLSKLGSVITKYPQVLVNVKNVDKSKLSSNSRIADVVSRQADLIKTDGQILVRPSGTENLVRIMVEAKTLQMAKKIADEISEVVKSEIGG